MYMNICTLHGKRDRYKAKRGIPQAAQHWSASEHKTRLASEADGLSNLVVELH